MGYSGAVSSEHSSGKRTQHGPITKTGNAWKAQYRLHKRYRNLVAAGKEKQKVVTAVGRELLGLSGPSEFKSNETANESHKPEPRTFPEDKDEEQNHGR